MATLTATVGSASLTLTGGSPYSLLSAKGMSGAEVRRVTSRGPAQDGDTDQGYRLAPREIELEIGIKAATDALLDAARDALTSLFKPLPSTPIKLRYTRDDAAIRQIDCYTVGNIKIDLVKDYRVGHYHRATIRLRAVEAALYNPTPGTVTVTGTAGIASDWWLAGGAIGTAQVMMSGGTPGLGEAWSYTSTLGTSASWTLAWRTSKVEFSTHLAYGVDNTADTLYSGTTDVFFESSLSNYYVNGLSAGGEMLAGTRNYFNSYAPFSDAGRTFLYASGTIDATTQVLLLLANNLSLTASTGKWRTSTGKGTGWAEAIPLYALYNPVLSDAQRNALSGYMIGAQGGSVSQAVTIPYGGDLPEYPTISIRGPITGALITNTATGDALDFGTAVIGAGTTYIINTNPAYKTVLQGTANKRGELTSDSDLGTWNISPSPTATGGTNIITIAGANTGTATQVSIVYYNRYASI
jgi:hypothetical protein